MYRIYSEPDLVYNAVFFFAAPRRFLALAINRQTVLEWDYYCNGYQGGRANFKGKKLT